MEQNETKDIDEIIEGLAREEEEAAAEPEAPEPEAKEEEKEEPVEPVFKTKEEADNYIAEKVIQALNESKEKEERERQSKEAEKFFDDSYIPKNANDLAANLIPILDKKIRDNIKAEQEHLTAEQQKINTLFDKQTDDLIKGGKLPPQDTDEGKQALGSMLKFGAQYGARDVNMAYDLWSKVPEEFGGGYKIKSEEKEKAKDQRAAAGMVGGLKSADPSKPKPLNYDQRRSTDMDSLIQDALEKTQ